MARPTRSEPGGRYIDIYFSPRQLDQLTAIQETAPYRPHFQSLVETAIDSFLVRELEKPEVRERVAQYNASKGLRVVTLREVSPNKKG